jgi:hypothetical protein
MSSEFAEHVVKWATQMPSSEVRNAAHVLLSRTLTRPTAVADMECGAAHEARIKDFVHPGLLPTFKGLLGAFAASVAIPQRSLNSKPDTSLSLAVPAPYSVSVFVSLHPCVPLCVWCGGCGAFVVRVCMSSSQVVPFLDI